MIIISPFGFPSATRRRHLRRIVEPPDRPPAPDLYSGAVTVVPRPVRRTGGGGVTPILGRITGV